MSSTIGFLRRTGLAGIHAATDSYHTNMREGSTVPIGTWPAFYEMIGGFFKFHWPYPTMISVKIDDPNSPLTSMFPVRGYVIVDETYTFAQNSFSRKRVHVLTSINYQKVSAEDKAKEPMATRRTDGDYVLSYIQRVGNGASFTKDTVTMRRFIFPDHLWSTYLHEFST